MSSSAPPAARVLRFDKFELDLHAGELRKNGIRLRLHGQPLQILAILLQSAGTVVTREEIHRQVWQADTFVDFDHSLHNAIARVREVLGDSAQAPRYIETLPRRGYRFIGQVEQAQPSATPIASETQEPVSAKLPVTTPPRARRLTTGLILALCACVVGVIAWTAWRDYRAGRPSVTRRSIAVLPLQNLSGDPAQDFFAEAMTDELITEISRIQALKVISRTSVMGYTNTREHLPQIARELQVDDIVEGSIVRDGDRVRVTVQLLDAPNDRHLWSEEYQRPLGSLLTLQKEIAETIAQQVRVTLTPQQQAQLGPAPAVAPQAYEAYLRGRYNLNLLFARHQPLDPAKEYFEESIRKDPGFAPAYAGLADTDVNIAYTQHRWSRDIYRSALQAAQKALQLDDHSGEAHATLAMLKWDFDWDWADAERELQYAIAVEPSYDCARDYHASLLAWEGRRDEALAEVKRARELNAGSSFATTESSIIFKSGTFPD